jgi:hypothetical protein
MTLEACAELQLKGFFKLEATDVITGQKRTVADWFPNLILNNGLNRLGVRGQQPLIASYCHVGTGNSAPIATETSLVTPLASTNTNLGSSSGYTAGPPEFVWATFTRRFAAGVAAGNLTEVGMGWGPGAGVLFSRALITDVGGNPTTVTVLATEVLDVTYELRIYPPTADVTGQVTISGTTYDYIIRPAELNNNLYWNASSINFYSVEIGHSLGSFTWAYTGTLGSRTSSPSGTGFGTSASLGSMVAYSNNSYQADGTVTFDLTQGNLSGGIRSFVVPMNGLAAFQTQLTPAIPKNSTNVLALNVRFSWARRP